MGQIEDLTEEQMGRLIGLAAAAKLVRGRWGGPPNLGTVRGWARDGYRPAGWRGEPAVLRTVVMGRDYLTLPEWVEEFARERLRLGQLARRPPLVEPAPRTRKASIRRAEAALDRAGIGGGS